MGFGKSEAACGARGLQRADWRSIGREGSCSDEGASGLAMAVSEIEELYIYICTVRRSLEMNHRKGGCGHP